MSGHAYISMADVPPSVGRVERRCEAIDETVVSFIGLRFSGRPRADGAVEFVVPRGVADRAELFDWFSYFGIPFLVLP